MDISTHTLDTVLCGPKYIQIYIKCSYSGMEWVEGCFAMGPACYVGKVHSVTDKAHTEMQWV